MKYPFLIIIPLFLLGGLLLLSVKANRSAGPQPSDRQLNLALRQIGHELLLAQGDSNSLVPSVRAGENNRWVLPLNRSVDYDLLVSIGSRVLGEFGRSFDYTLAVEDCRSAELLLGYRWSYVEGNGNAACTGREQEAGACHNVSLCVERPREATFPLRTLSGSASILLGFLLLFTLRGSKNATPARPVPAGEQSPPLLLSERITFDFAHQQLTIDGQPEELTYREAKLLHYLSENANQILDREAIKAAVWGSEGVIVGRSLDVFVSRLRKKLAVDPSLNIQTVRGVGYQLKTGLDTPTSP